MTPTPATILFLILIYPASQLGVWRLEQQGRIHHSRKLGPRIALAIPICLIGGLIALIRIETQSAFHEGFLSAFHEGFLFSLILCSIFLD